MMGRCNMRKAYNSRDKEYHSLRIWVPMPIKFLPNAMYFLPNEELYSNAIKSILAIHDDQRLPKNDIDGINTMRSEAVQGEFPCFCRHLPVDNVTDDTMTLGFRGGQNIVQLIHNMKWSEREEDKAHKQAFLSSLLLHIYAELFVKGFVPNVLRWSYPSAMGYNLMLQYNQIWQSLQHVSPVIDVAGNPVPLSVSTIPGMNTGDMGSSGFGTTEDISESISNDGFSNDNPFGGGDPLEVMPLAQRILLLLHRMRFLYPILQVHLMIVIILWSIFFSTKKKDQKPLVPNRDPLGLNLRI